MCIHAWLKSTCTHTHSLSLNWKHTHTGSDFAILHCTCRPVWTYTHTHIHTCTQRFAFDDEICTGGCCWHSRRHVQYMSYSNNNLTWQHSAEESAWRFLRYMQCRRIHPSLLMLDCIICITLSGIHLVCMQRDAWMQTLGFIHAAYARPGTCPSGVQNTPVRGTRTWAYVNIISMRIHVLYTYWYTDTGTEAGLYKVWPPCLTRLDSLEHRVMLQEAQEKDTYCLWLRL